MSSLLFGNGTDLVHWKPSPTTRGTSDILSTCIITMLLCVWTAVHLNVSPPESVWTPRLRKVGWLVLALLAPEVVAYTAWYVLFARDVDDWISGHAIYHIQSKVCRLINVRYQRRQALTLMRRVNEACVLPNPPSWHATTFEGIKRTITRLKRVFMPQKQEPTRVSRDI